MVYNSRMKETYGFTLIEIAIALIIIGLVIGGILTGSDLITAGKIRITVSQIEQYKTAVRTFQAKYGGLPGDLPNGDKFGFATTIYFGGSLGSKGYRDGNGLIEGVYFPGGAYGQAFSEGEPYYFWSDLSDAGLISGTYGVNHYALPPDMEDQDIIHHFFPPSKLGRNNTVYVYSDHGQNYLGIAQIDGIWNTFLGQLVTTTSIKPVEALSIDRKMDDGYPQTGSVIAKYLDEYWGTIAWWQGDTFTADWGWAYGQEATNGWGPWGASDTSATPADNYTCFDNGNVAGAKQQYSLSVNGGENLNCALSFKF